jgi:hypothetical protein
METVTPTITRTEHVNRNEQAASAPRTAAPHNAVAAKHAITWAYAPCSAVAGTVSLAFHRSPTVILVAVALPLLPCLLMTLTFAASYLRIIVFAVGEAKRPHGPGQESWAADLHSLFEACTNSAVGFLTLTPMRAAASLRCRKGCRASACLKAPPCDGKRQCWGVSPVRSGK